MWAEPQHPPHTTFIPPSYTSTQFCSPKGDGNSAWGRSSKVPPGSPDRGDWHLEEGSELWCLCPASWEKPKEKKWGKGKKGKRKGSSHTRKVSGEWPEATLLCPRTCPQGPHWLVQAGASLQPHQDDFGLVQLCLHSGHWVSIPGVLGRNDTALPPPHRHQGAPVHWDPSTCQCCPCPLPFSWLQATQEPSVLVPCRVPEVCTWYLLRYPSKAE